MASKFKKAVFLIIIYCLFWHLKSFKNVFTLGVLSVCPNPFFKISLLSVSQVVMTTW